MVLLIGARRAAGTLGCLMRSSRTRLQATTDPNGKWRLIRPDAGMVSFHKFAPAPLIGEHIPGLGIRGRNLIVPGFRGPQPTHSSWPIMNPGAYDQLVSMGQQAGIGREWILTRPDA